MKTGIQSLLLFFIFLFSVINSIAQDEEKRGFKKERIFIGSSLSLGISGDAFQIGASPEIGYSLTKWLDAGIGFNINYASYRYQYFTDQYLNYGIASVVRIWPVDFLFISAIPEYNWIDITRKYVDNNIASESDKFNAGSLLLGAGYGKRIVGRAYSYFALMFDALNNKYSPYRDAQGRAIPIIRAGFAFYLSPSNKE
jgi:hypothetical protein